MPEFAAGGDAWIRTGLALVRMRSDGQPEYDDTTFTDVRRNSLA
ncbi:hypothetical protein OG394_21160 [Kribbella sp. NBC_01245]|nr:hypothetical protein [Kribbella sp. NBC_01245]